jgi:hypothetical protein
MAFRWTRNYRKGLKFRTLKALILPCSLQSPERRLYLQNMNAALLNKAKRERMGLPVFPGLEQALKVVTEDAALWGTEALGESKKAPKWDADKLIGWVETGAAIQAANKIATGGVNFGEMAAAMATGAGVGVMFGGAGAIAGAILGGVMYLVQAISANQVPTLWQNAAPGVHTWFTNRGPQEFLDYVRDEQPALLGTDIPTLAKALGLYWLEKYGYVLTTAPGRSFYSGIPDNVYVQDMGGAAVAETIYKPMGVDYVKTNLEAYPAGTPIPLYNATSQGMGGVWTYDRKVYAPPPEDGEDEGGGNNGALIAGGVGLAAFLVYLKTTNQI